jgi:hypothetical protein
MNFDSPSTKTFSENGFSELTLDERVQVFVRVRPSFPSERKE